MPLPSKETIELLSSGAPNDECQRVRRWYIKSRYKNDFLAVLEDGGNIATAHTKRGRVYNTYIGSLAAYRGIHFVPVRQHSPPSHSDEATLNLGWM